MSSESIFLLVILGLLSLAVIAWGRGWSPFQKTATSLPPGSDESSDGNQSEPPKSRHLKKQFEDMRRRLDKVDQDLKSRITIDRFNAELKKLREEVQLLATGLRDAQAVQKQILAVRATAIRDSFPAQEAMSPEISEVAPPRHKQPADIYTSILLVPELKTPSETSVRTQAPELEMPQPERTPQTEPHQQEIRRSANELIVLNFDRIDGLARRQIERMKTEYHSILGNQLKDITDRRGAYVFEMNNSTLWVHPKPNAPLNRYWERAFPRAESYSLAIQHVDSVASVRFNNDEEYDVLSIGSFKVN